MLNRHNPSDVHTQEAPEDLDINVEPPTKEEIVAVIKELKNQNAAAKCRVNKNRPRTSIKSILYPYLSQYGRKRSFRKTGAKAQL